MFHLSLFCIVVLIVVIQYQRTVCYSKTTKPFKNDLKLIGKHLKVQLHYENQMFLQNSILYKERDWAFWTGVYITYKHRHKTSKKNAISERLPYIKGHVQLELQILFQLLFRWLWTRNLLASPYSLYLSCIFSRNLRPALTEASFRFLLLRSVQVIVIGNFVCN